MAKSELKTYSEVIQHLKKENRQKHLLMGNGFSMSYDSGIFSYNALSKFIYELKDKELHQLFDILNTNNFELMMQQLDNAAQIATVFGVEKKIVDRIKKASETLKSSLIEAIKELHPEHVFSVSEEKSIACATYLKSFLDDKGQVFTTNYDLLLYWILERNQLANRGDGFGRETDDTEEWINPDDRDWSEIRWGKNKDTQAIHYLHGALHLFDTGIDIIKEEYTNEHFLLENVKARMAKKEYPIFVTAGSGKDKLTHIMHNKYLANCFESLSTISGTLICFGFGFGPYDEHIIKAINKAYKWREVEEGKLERLQNIYIGVYSDKDAEHINSIKKKFKVPLRMFDAKTVNIWGHD
jgi:hypothetical protein